MTLKNTPHPAGPAISITDMVIAAMAVLIIIAIFWGVQA